MRSSRSIVASMAIAGVAACSLFTDLGDLSSKEAASGGIADGGGPSDGQPAPGSDGGEAAPDAGDGGGPRALLVVAGGYVTSTAGTRLTRDVLTAPLLEDGGVGEFQGAGALTLDTRLPNTMVTAGTAVFALANDNVLSASTKATPGLSLWSEQPAYTFRRDHCAVAAGDSIYVLGGRESDEGVAITSVLTTRTGTTLAWSDARPLPAPRYFLGCTATERFVYAISGKNSSGTHLSEVLVAERDPTTGALGEWKSTTALPTTAYQPHAVVAREHVFVLGHLDGRSETTVLSAEIQADGKLGPWQTNHEAPMAISDASVAALGDRIVVTGGDDAQGGPPWREVSVGVVDASGEVTWSLTTPMPGGRTAHGSALVPLP